jgi:hypothetical protein
MVGSGCAEVRGAPFAIGLLHYIASPIVLYSQKHIGFHIVPFEKGG